MRKILFLIVLASVLSLYTVSANVIFNQVQDSYNIGDALRSEITIFDPDNTIRGNFELFLTCEDDSKSIYKDDYVSLNVGEEKKISKIVLLNKVGDCQLEANLADNVYTSKTFNVSSGIEVVFTADKLNVEPSNTIILEGTAIKANGGKVDGFANASILNTSIESEGIVKEGSFLMELNVPEDMRSGSYSIEVYVYEKVDEEVSNHGESHAFMTVLSVPKKIEFALSSTNVTPEDKISFKPILYDQALDEIEEYDIIVRIRDSESTLIYEGIVKSGDEDETNFKETAKPGNWEISASALNISSKKIFYMGELEKAEFIIENNTLTVINRGNVPYTKGVQVDIGGEVRIIDIYLAVGETKKLKLYAPDGEYDVTVTDGESETTRRVLLTGNSISVRDVASAISFKRYFFAWLFLFFIVGLFIYSTAAKVLPGVRRFKSKEKSAESVIVMPDKKKENTRKLSEIVLTQHTNPSYAEHTIVLKGEKQESSLIILNIKNFDKITHFKDILGKINNKIIENKGSVYQNNNFLVGIFPPVLTKTFKNDITAVKLAKEFEDMLTEHNKKFKERMKFGLAVHTGDLILEKTPQKLKFTSSGNTLAYAKKLSEVAEDEFLMSEVTYKKSGSEIKATRENKDNFPLYRLNKVVDKGVSNDKFIRDFLARNKDMFGKQ